MPHMCLILSLLLFRNFLLLFDLLGTEKQQLRVRAGPSRLVLLPKTRRTLQFDHLCRLRDRLPLQALLTRSKGLSWNFKLLEVLPPCMYVVGLSRSRYSPYRGRG